MTGPVPDPSTIRHASLHALQRMGLALPPQGFGLVWEPGDEIGLRPPHEIEDRVAILNVVLARCFGLPSGPAMAWLNDAGLVNRLTKPEWMFVANGDGDQRIFSLHLDALFALAWVLGIVMDLDPLQPSPDGLAARLPRLAETETYTHWRARTLTGIRAPDEVAAALDLYYCLDWAYLEAETHQFRLPGPLNSNAIGQRRWALEWAVVFSGPFHDPSPGWEEIDLST